MPPPFGTRAHQGCAAVSCASGDLHPCDAQPRARPLSQPRKDFAPTPTGWRQVSSPRPWPGRAIPGHPGPLGLHPCPIAHGTPGAGHRPPLHPQELQRRAGSRQPLGSAGSVARTEVCLLLTSLLAFGAGSSDLLLPGSRAVPAEAPEALPAAAPGRAGFSLPFPSHQSPPDLSPRTPCVFPWALLTDLALPSAAWV